MPIIRIKEDNPLVVSIFKTGSGKALAELRLEGINIAGKLKIKKGKKGNPGTEICDSDLAGDDELELEIT